MLQQQVAKARTQAWIDAETLMIFACEQAMTRDRLLGRCARWC